MVIVWNSLHFVQDGKVLEGRAAVHHLIQDTSKGPYIAGPTDFEVFLRWWTLDSLW